ncbi:histone H3-K56 acetyltransferase, RTT109 [Cynara cardunculus var. scolymus]|uniref:histone acetyltransferase n=1 Tax=Cynara cardunculus var. scolymus TaxID=59895 RepID=A0A118K1F8_CYNCS|nr:histone H3-K56 acetyltransferase, RTT109 [Cynara cardunculus var. scolymus]
MWDVNHHAMISHGVISSDSAVNVGYNCYNYASINTSNPGYFGGSSLKDYSQNVASTNISCDGMNMIPPLDRKQAYMEFITSPEHASCITASSYEDAISDTEAYDSNFQYNPESAHFLPSKYNSHRSDCGALLQSEVPFQQDIHAAECKNNLCKCHALNCNICGPARRSCGTANFFLGSRKRKFDTLDPSIKESRISTGTLVDMLPANYLNGSIVVDQISQEFSLSPSQQGLPVQLPCLEQWPKASVHNEDISTASWDRKANSIITEDSMRINQSKNLNAAFCEQKSKGAEGNGDTTNDEFKEPPEISSKRVHLCVEEKTSDEKEESSQVGPKAGEPQQANCESTAASDVYDSVLESEETNIQNTSMDENDSGLGSKNIKTPSTSMADSFTTSQIKEHLLSFPRHKWVQCDRCQHWQHRICGLYNNERHTEGEEEYICPKCCLEEIEDGRRVALPPTAVLGAKDLPRTNLSDHIEQRLARRMKQERVDMAEFSGIELGKLEVRQQYRDILDEEDYPAQFAYRSKSSTSNQKEIPQVVNLFVPSFTTKYWYKSMLRKAAEDDVVVDNTNLYNQFFVPTRQGNTKITAARLPYFDGDYWSTAAESIIKKLEEEESSGGLRSRLPTKRTLIAMGLENPDVVTKDVLVMQRLGETILHSKENFMIVRLQYMCTYCHEDVLSNVPIDTKDGDDALVNNFFETRDDFLNKCQKSEYQFDTLGHAKYSSMMILYHFMNELKLTQPSTKAISKTRSDKHKQRVMMIKASLDALMHASKCKSIQCSYPDCRTIRKLLHHASICSVRGHKKAPSNTFIEL